MTQREIDRALPFWLRALRLEDWTVTVRQGTAREMNPDKHGACEGLNYICPEELHSLVLLRRGADEETLVHELLHLVFDGDREQNGTYDVLHERALNRVARALVELKAGGVNNE